MPDLRPVHREPDEGGGDIRSRPRWSANRNMDVVMRLLRGESLDSRARELGVEAHRLAAWRDDFISGGKEALKTRAGVSSAEESRRLRRSAALTQARIDAIRAHLPPGFRDIPTLDLRPAG